MRWAEIDLEYLAGVLATAAAMPVELACRYQHVLCRGRLLDTDEAWLWQVEQRFRPGVSAVEEQLRRLRRDEASAEQRRLMEALLAATGIDDAAVPDEAEKHATYH